MRVQLFCLFLLGLLQPGYGLDVAVVAGGGNRFDAKILSATDPTTEGYDCSAGLPDLPQTIKSGIGFANKDGKPLVCGGKINANAHNQQCYIYEKDSNSWVDGPTTLKKRRKAVAVGLPNGSTWIIGGTKLFSTEIYNPTTDNFEDGPDVPISFMLSPCAVKTPRDTILILGKPQKSQDNNKLFEYTPADGNFNELAEMPGSAVDMVCGIDDSSSADGELFFAYGGYSTYADVTGDAYVYSVDSDAWTTFPNKFCNLERIFGSATLQMGTEAALAIDGVNPAIMMNLSFKGFVFSGDGTDPTLESYKWAEYSYPPTTDNELQRRFPVAFWVNADMVCQST